MKKLSVIIVNYNVCYFLEQALVSVFKALKEIDGEVFVVDNHSLDGSVAMVRRRFPQVHLIANRENAGFSKANNQALELARGQYVLLLNPDTVVEEDTFTKCLAFMDQHPLAGGLGVKMLDGKGQFLPESKRGLPTPWVALYKIVGLASLFPSSRIFGRYYLGYLDAGQVQEVEVLAGAFMLLRRESLLRTGFLDENFFMYGEDIDLSYRLLQAGYKNYYFPQTRIIHYKGESTRRGSLNYVYLFYRAMSVFVRKHFAGRQANVFSALIQVAIYLRAGMSVFTRFVNKVLPYLLEGGLIYGGMYGLKRIWEKTFKHEPAPFPDTFMEVAVPAYIFIWMASAFLSGAYDQPRGWFRLFRGILLGTILISALSNFLDQYRFSKAMILLGQLWALAVIAGRLLISSRVAGNTGKKIKTIAVVGGEAEYQRVAGLLRAAAVPARLAGFLSADPTDGDKPHFLGYLEELNQVSVLNNLDELIFCGQDLSAAEIMEWMVQLNNRDLQYKILPEGSDYIIGSHSKSTPGDYYALEIELNLFQEYFLRQKRVLDISSALLFLITSPLCIWLVQEKTGFFKNCLRVLAGRYSWVGLRSTLPAGRALPGVLSPADLYLGPVPGPETQQKIEVLYAKEYNPAADLRVIFGRFHCLGRPVR